MDESRIDMDLLEHVIEYIHEECETGAVLVFLPGGFLTQALRLCPNTLTRLQVVDRSICEFLASNSELLRHGVVKDVSIRWTTAFYYSM